VTISPPSPDSDTPPSDRPLPLASRVSHVLFGLFIMVALTNPSLTRGALTWLPLVQLSGIEDGPVRVGPVRVGPVSLLPILTVVTWGFSRWRDRPRQSWRWGAPGVTLPLAGFTLLTILGLDPAPTHRTMVVAMMLLMMWGVYLFVVNEQPDLRPSVIAVLLIQGSVAVGQFALQRDLGLQWLGEPVLDVHQSGISVLSARGRRWLRAYGLAGHPNLLGATLAALLLLLVAETDAGRDGKRTSFALAASAGMLGLVATFSRGAWLAFGLGLVCWIARRVTRSSQTHAAFKPGAPFTLGRPLKEHVHLIVPVALALLLLASSHDLVLSRFFQLDSPTEAPSIEHRQVDAGLAVRLIRQHPWTGVGAQNYLPAVRAIESNSRTVHNVFLLTGAELGLPGAALWLWVTLSVLARPAAPTWASWTALTVAGLFDVAVHPTNNWFASVLVGLTAAGASIPRVRGSGAAAGREEGTRHAA